MVAGERRRSFAFRPITGAIEMVLAELSEDGRSTPLRITSLLTAVLAEVGGQVATEELVAGLCVADRQFLLRQLLVHLGRDEVWLSADCGACGGRFDLQVRHSSLPVQEAQDFPQTRVTTAGGFLCVRVPTGEDQAAIAVLGFDQARSALARRLVLGRDDDGIELKPWSDAVLAESDLAAMDERMDAVFPQVATRVQTTCPECGQANVVDVSPLRFLHGTLSELLSEVDLLARNYHWSEADILALPRTRRQRYARFLDRARGMVE
jgi:hypothetical protein